nr:MAG TPA: hypothetical protein [Caudoviricetes sp.]
MQVICQIQSLLNIYYIIPVCMYYIHIQGFI